MFFFLSKALSFLTQPYTVICLLFIASFTIRSATWKKRLFWTAFGLLIFFSNEFIANEAMRAWEIETKPFNEMQKYKLGIVLTGATVSGIDPNDRVYFHRGADRVTHTVQLFKLGLIEKILISGGTGRLVEGEDEPEANKFKKAMMLMGVPEHAIIIENETRNTAESAIEVQKLLKEFGYKSEECLLITSAFHMRRSVAAYRKAGLNLETFSTDFYSRKRVFYLDALLIPQLDAMIKWQKLTKEWIGMLAYKVVGYI